MPSSTSGIPKRSPSVYPLNISIDERVPLNMGAGGFFSRKGPITDFLKVVQNIFAGAPKSGKIAFSPLETRKKTFFCNN